MLDPGNGCPGYLPAFQPSHNLQHHLRFVLYPFCNLTNVPEGKLRREYGKLRPQRRVNGREETARGLWVPEDLPLDLANPFTEAHVGRQVGLVAIRATCDAALFHIVQR